MIRLVIATLTVAIGVMLVVTMGRTETLTRFYNDKGQVIGYGQSKGNETTFSNSKGEQTGKEVRGRDGGASFYNEKGQRIGGRR
jgi:hypothetical protein